MNKSLLTNIIALLLVVIGLLMSGPWQNLVLNTGLFALSGGITNWLAIHMLFEKVPGFYGSGVIPARFEEFKEGIKTLIMEQFFNPENIKNFFSRLGNDESDSGIKNLVDSVDLSGAFESLVEVIMASSFGSMLSMLGGAEALQPLKDPFVEKMKEFLASVGEDKEVMSQLKHSSTEALLDKVEDIVDQRLEELTPELVKEIIQQMIRKHLGWLVVWGGVLGGVIGLVVTLSLT
jgi:uncharacterized membrane protein YheB (UPF0754 family)